MRGAHKGGRFGYGRFVDVTYESPPEADDTLTRWSFSVEYASSFDRFGGLYAQYYTLAKNYYNLGVRSEARPIQRRPGLGRRAVRDSRHSVSACRHHRWQSLITFPARPRFVTLRHSLEDIWPSRFPREVSGSGEEPAGEDGGRDTDRDGAKVISGTRTNGATV